MRPKTLIIKASDIGKRVIAATMGIAGQIVQRAKLPENRDIGGGAERLFQLDEVGDLVRTQVTTIPESKVVGLIMTELRLASLFSRDSIIMAR